MSHRDFGNVIGRFFGERSISRRRFTQKSALHKAAAIRLSSLLRADLIKIPLLSTTKKMVLLELVELLNHAGKITDTECVYQSILSREQLISTGIGNRIAIPQGKTTETTEVLCAFGIHPEGIHFTSIDGQPADIFFLVVAPENEPEFVLMKLLATLSHILKSETHQQRIRALTSAQDAMAFFTVLDNEGDSRKNTGGCDET